MARPDDIPPLCMRLLRWSDAVMDQALLRRWRWLASVATAIDRVALALYRKAHR
ncbi:MAG: hypothetical protein RJA36_1324 [Pseudomonadota bacterium]|jgi:hypothetical protein